MRFPAKDSPGFGRGLRRAAGVACVAGAALAAGAAGAWAWRRFGPATYVRAKTMFGKTRIYQVEDDVGVPVRLLEVGGVVQSGTYVDEHYTELVFEYLRLYDLMFGAARPIRRVCVLGCGGYDYPEHLVAHHPEVQVDAVEIDPAITELARRYFFLDRLIAEYDALATGRLRLVCADALEHLQAHGGCDGEGDWAASADGGLGGVSPIGAGGSSAGRTCAPCAEGDAGRTCAPCADVGTGAGATDCVAGRRGRHAAEDGCGGWPRGRYDAIVNDTFDAGTPPAHLTTSVFVRAVHDALEPGGVYLVNYVSPLAGRASAFLRGQVGLLEAQFAHVVVIPCDPDALSEGDNVIVMASDAPLPEAALERAAGGGCMGSTHTF